MSTIHDQAMNYVYQQVLQRLLSFFSRAERTALQLLIQRLAVAAGGMDRIGEFKVLAIQSGTRDCCYSLALLRAAQLSIAGRAPATFQLRVATLRCNGVPPSALQNLHRSFSALFLHDDPRVELLMVDHREIQPFNHLAPVCDEGREASRLALLMVGHRRSWEEDLTLWDHQYLTTAEFYGQVARWKNGVDALISSDNARRQEQFLDGLDRAVNKVGLGKLSRKGGGFDELFSLLDSIGGDCYRELYSQDDQVPWRPIGEFEACRRTSYIGIDDMVVGKMEERWPLLSDFLGFQADDLMFEARTGECADPLVGAYLKGMQASHTEGRTYEVGVSEYLQQCLATMRSRNTPEQVCERFESAFGNLSDLAEHQSLAANSLQKNFGLNETQLVCLLFAPFIDAGAGLERFLRTCHPGMLVAMPDLHRAMQGLHAPEQVLQWMTDVSGLPLRLICRLYAMGAVRTGEHVAKAQELPEREVTLGDRSAEG
ncbi:hypothetical protein [Pseudomonas fitomaticsae]|uniref:Uncharacterized protein n=1 Tax=Pseudomonas fitomaticsae TaxID=2837969 RepID=A0ABY3PTZ8_9PSED|nr:hypothetical protein [Pseudomonas fitomaticsae]UFP97403.1 hypothetical protein KJY40_15060 [Pseudomonas fitomaticsae]